MGWIRTTPTRSTSRSSRSSFSNSASASSGTDGNGCGRSSARKRWSPRWRKRTSGTLDLGECSKLLEQMGLNPRTRAEQRQIACLFEIIDEDGSGELDFAEFNHLFQRVHERMQAVQRREELEAAKKCGMSM